jgi:beta-lactamase class D
MFIYLWSGFASLLNTGFAMKINNQIILFSFLSVFALASCRQKQTTEIRDDFKKLYEQYHVEGSFLLYDQNADKYIIYNEPQVNEQFIPASTFKICNSLIGLETGVITDENFLIAWDSIKRRDIWDKDHTLKTAFRNSVVWYYQELARRVGGQKMKYWLDKAHYGNADTSGGIDKFWLSGGLRISPLQQIDFLQRLHDNKLPFSQRSVDIVKNIMVVKDTLGYEMRAKTGWGFQDGKDIGWYVGYVETAGNVYYFSNCVQTLSQNTQDEKRSKQFDKSRREIVDSILKELKVIE